MSKPINLLILGICMGFVSVSLMVWICSTGKWDYGKAQESYALIKLNNGPLIPNIGLGTWTMNDTQAKKAVKEAVGVGYRHIDTAWRYDNEKGIGQALKELIDDNVIAREDIFITSKVWNTYHSRALAVEAIQQSLQNLGLDYLDLALIHWPTGFKAGTAQLYPRQADGSIIPSDEDIVDTWRGMEDAYKQGFAKSIGVSNFNVHQLERLMKEASIKPAVNQFESHPMLTRPELVNFCQNISIAVVAYSPLRQADPDLLENPLIKEIALKHKKTTAQVILRWQIERDVIVIPKTIRKHRMIENIDIFDFKLTNEEMVQICSLNANKRLIDIPGIQSHPDYPF